MTEREMRDRRFLAPEERLLGVMAEDNERVRYDTRPMRDDEVLTMDKRTGEVAWTLAGPWQKLSE